MHQEDGTEQSRLCMSLGGRGLEEETELTIECYRSQGQVLVPVADFIHNVPYKAPMESSSYDWATELPCFDDDDID